MLSIILLFLCIGHNAAPHPRRRKGKERSRTFQELVDKLWRMDGHRVELGPLFYQGRAGNADNATQDLFSPLDKRKFDKPIYKAFIALFDNYNRREGQAETYTRKERGEIKRFFHLLMTSPLMKEVYKFVKEKEGKKSKRGKWNRSKFRKRVYDLWFALYSRRRSSSIKDSSGFEHVFIGDVKGSKNTVGGMHNWVRIYQEEKKGHFNYYGYIKKHETPVLLTFRFTWYNARKKIGGCFLGTSPEFEMALYTVVYLMRYKNEVVRINGVDLKIICYSINGGRSIGTCYPVAPIASTP